MFKLKKDDLLVVKELDRLGRNYTEIIDEWSIIVNKIGADIVVPDMHLRDTRTPLFSRRKIHFGYRSASSVLCG